jgi:aspartate/methionine/tyrosine aminotransferase
MTGWRIGYLAAHSQIIRIISKLQQHMNTNTCTFVQKGACASFSLDPDYLNFYIKQLKTNVDAMIDTLKANSKIHLIAPKGGLFSFINISKAGLKSDEFAYKLLAKKNVALTPGISFGDNWDDHVRISLATGSDDFKEGMELIDEFVRGL